MNKLKIFSFIILFGIISQYKTFICNDDINSEYKEKKEQEIEEDNEENEVQLPLWKDILLIATPVATLVTLIVFGAYLYKIKKNLSESAGSVSLRDEEEDSDESCNSELLSQKDKKKKKEQSKSTHSNQSLQSVQGPGSPKISDRKTE